MKTGDIFWVNLDPTVGDEIRKKRPVIVLNQGHEKNLRLSIVVPITGWQKHWETNPFFVVIKPSDQNGLQKKSAIDCFQIRAISHTRFMDRIGKITDKQLGQVRQSIALILDIDSEDCQ
ncbi:type II toxin-antitoxin system PemK/MazF family toxin [bacterium]|nr:type II toxin-antitoxin system PemK/MazF family toxin [bacterium]